MMYVPDAKVTLAVLTGGSCVTAELLLCVAAVVPL